MTSEDDDISRNPYRLLFPVGIFIGAIAVLLWIFFERRFINFYPRAAHGNLMFFGMLWPFVAGFLMTAIPRMTGGERAGVLEMGTATLLAFFQVVFNLRNLTDLGVILFGFQILFLAVFILRRFLVTRRVPFAGFVFLPFAFAQAIAGFSIYFSGSHSRDLFLLLAGEGFIMNLILGLGSRLIPAISRLPQARLPNEQSAPDEGWVKPVGVALVLNLGYATEALGFIESARVLRLVAVGLGALLLLKLHRLPVQWTVIGIGLKLGLLMTLAGQAMALFGIGPVLAAQHLIYIGGFALITLLISTRVVLAHGGGDLKYEVRSTQLAMLVLFLVFAGLLRWSAGANPVGVAVTLSAALFCAGLAMWTWRFKW